MKSLPAEFSVDRALECLELVDLAYEYYRTKKLPGTLPGDYELVGEIVSHEGEQMVSWGLLCHSSSEKRLLMFLRGTEGDVEWFEDIVESAQMEPKRFPEKCRVHEGFRKIFDGLAWKSIDGALQHKVIDGPISDQFSDSEWIITGHSLGAPLALFACLQAHFRSWCNSPPQLYSFASPRVGDEKFVELFDESGIRNFRIVNQWDVVPHVPPREFYDPFDLREFVYRHCGSEVLIDGGASLDVAHNHSLNAYRKGLISLTDSQD